METDVELRQLKNIPRSPLQTDDLFHVHTAGNIRYQNKHKLLEQTMEEAITSIRRLRFLCIALVIIIVIMAAGFGYLCYHLVTRISSAEDLLEMVNTNLNSHYATSLKGNTLDIQANYYSVTDISARMQTLNETLRKLKETSRQTFGTLELEVKSVNGSMHSQFEASRKSFDELVEDIKTVDIAMSTKLDESKRFADNLNSEIQTVNETVHKNSDEFTRSSDNLSAEIQIVSETFHKISDKSKQFADNLSADLQSVNDTLHKKSDESKRFSYDLSTEIQSVNETLHQRLDESKRVADNLSTNIQSVNETLHRKSDELRRISDNLRMKIEFVSKTLKKTSVETGIKTRSLKLKTDWLIDSFLSITETSPKSFDELSTDLKSPSSTLYETSEKAMLDDMPEMLEKANKRVRRKAENITRDLDEMPDNKGENSTNKQEKYEDTTTESSDLEPISKDTTPKQSETPTIAFGKIQTEESASNKTTPQTSGSPSIGFDEMSTKEESEVKKNEIHTSGLTGTTFDNTPTLEPERYHTTLKQLDSQWGEWSVWSKCSVTCGRGHIMRARVCKKSSTVHGGLNCTGSSIERKSCSTFSCPVHGGWSIWGNWSACSRTCGDGIRRRLRTCNNPQPSILGAECVGDASEYELCHDKPCPVDGHWSDWSMWSSCSASCGSGKMTRFRACTNPAPTSSGSACTGPNVEEKSCLVTSCLEVVDGGWSLWTNWSKCSTTCGQGMRRRERTCTDPIPSSLGSDCQGDSAEYELCTVQGCSVDGHWSAWSMWSGCSASCGKGEMTRLRSCANPSPANGGLNCTGPDTQMQSCEAVSCPVHGGWTSWYDWSSCSISCGQGIRQRHRNCTDPPPSILGDYCSGDSSEYEMCVTKLCPVDGHWSSWSMWSSCSVSCGKGEMTRFRPCASPSPSNGGLNCTGPDAEIQICEAISCPVHGGWTSWYDWSSCSSSCGQGIRQRHRNCTDPPPSILGDFCSGDSSEYGMCVLKLCPVDGQWTSWSMWSGCSVSCGSGHMTRVRACSNPSPANGGSECSGAERENKTCEGAGCPAIEPGDWSSWDNWSKCSSSCGQGIRQRSRNCTSSQPLTVSGHCPGDSVEYDLCLLKLCPVDGQWAAWSDWSSCSVTCGSGQMRRLRSCSNPRPAGGGLSCIGPANEQTTCTTVACPVSGGWSDWSTWSSCDATCGVGTSHRRRDCTNPVPSATGSFCIGDSVEYKSCQGSFAEGGVRLSDGSSTNEGRVEVCYKGEWGTICDDSWDSSDAKVVCKMLGRSGGTAFSSAHYGQGSGEIFLDDVKCSGDEGSLLQCNHRGFGNHNCGHGEDAGVKCS